LKNKTRRDIQSIIAELCDFRHVSAKGSKPPTTHKKRCMRRRALMRRRPRLDEMKRRRELMIRGKLEGQD
jgi:hypothetical protein